MCKWDKCQELREQVLEVLPSDHPWVGAPLQVQSHGVTLKKMALRHRVIELLIAENSDKRMLIIHRHHFSIVGWEHSKQKTVLLDKPLAQEWDNHYGWHPGYTESKNSVEVIAEKLGMCVSSREKGKYVEAPIVSADQVRNVLQLERDASSRALRLTKKRSAVDATLPTPRRLSQRTELIVTPSTSAKKSVSPMRLCHWTILLVS